MYELPNIPMWYVVQTKPKQEDIVSYNLVAGGIETYFPKIYRWKSNKKQANTVNRSKPLFPRYIFAKFNALNMFRTVRYTRGVQCILSYGLTPCPVDEEVIGLIKEKCEDEEFFVQENNFNKGDKVKITKPYLQDFSGVFEKELKGTDRVSILLTVVNYQAHIVVEKQFVEMLD